MRKWPRLTLVCPSPPRMVNPAVATGQCLRPVTSVIACIDVDRRVLTSVISYCPPPTPSTRRPLTRYVHFIVCGAAVHCDVRGVDRAWYCTMTSHSSGRLMERWSREFESLLLLTATRGICASIPYAPRKSFYILALYKSDYYYYYYFIPLGV